MDNLLFQAIRVVVTPGVLNLLSKRKISKLLKRHMQGDWGDLCEDDKEIYDRALLEGGRVLSSFTTSKGTVWITTDANRLTTTVLLPSEY